MSSKHFRHVCIYNDTWPCKTLPQCDPVKLKLIAVILATAPSSMEVIRCASLVNTSSIKVKVQNPWAVHCTKKSKKCKQFTWLYWKYSYCKESTLEKSLQVVKKRPQIRGPSIFQWSPLNAVDTVSNCQRLAFTVGVSQHMHKITNLWKFELNRSSSIELAR